jgi:hypothetical protein
MLLDKFIQISIDLTEFKDYLQAQIGEQIDMSDFTNLFSDIKAQAN